MANRAGDSAKDIRPEDIRNLKELLEKIIEKLSDAAIPRELQNLNLLAGLTQPRQYVEIENRLKMNPEEKGNLAIYLTDLVASSHRGKENVTRIFIESGSTLAHFASRLAEGIRLGELPADLEILTNNFLVLTAFGVGRVAVTPGSLESDYLAFLPFRNAHRSARLGKDESRSEIAPRITEQDRAGDIDAFRSLDRAIGSVQDVYMTASHFGFLVGPHVGSRANAIFKYCLLNNRANRRIRLCVAQSKVHRAGESSGGMSPDQIEKILRNECYTVFNLGRRLDWTEDPDLLTDYQVMQAEKRDSKPEPATQEHEDQLRSAPTEMGLPMNTDGSELCEGYGLTGLHGTWRSYLKNCTPGSLEIIIGLGNEAQISRTKDELRDSVKAANEILAGSEETGGWGLDRAYVEHPDSLDKSYALHLVVTGRGSDA